MPSNNKATSCKSQSHNPRYPAPHQAAYPNPPLFIPLPAPQHRQQPRQHNRETRLARRSQTVRAPSEPRNRRARAAAGALSRRSGPHRHGRTSHESAAGVAVPPAPGRDGHRARQRECRGRALAECGRACECGAGLRGGCAGAGRRDWRECSWGAGEGGGSGIGVAGCVALRDGEVAARVGVDGAGVGAGGVAGGGGALPA